MKNDNERYLSINKVALKLDTSPLTIKRWYKWYESAESVPEDLILPKYYFIDGRKGKMFLKDDVKVLRAFQKSLNSKHRGVMADFNATYQWGVYGRKRLEKKANE